MFSCQWKEQMEREITNFRRERSGSRFRLLVCLFFLLHLSFILAETALAANGDPVETIGNPADTRIDIFDYWIYNNDAQSIAVYDQSYNSGINQDHTLIFRRNTGNDWTGYGGGATQGIVKPLLGADGFPVLNCFGCLNSARVHVGNCYNADGTCPAAYSEESLAYLFDYSDIDVTMTIKEGTDDEQTVTKPAKRVYGNVNKLFTVDEDGHYLFDSVIHKAVIDRDDCYGTDVCDATVTEQTNGMFFPLSNGVQPSGNQNPEGWFLGVHIKSEFSIPYLGLVQNQNGEYMPMIYHFTGDDDVWVYIDGILIGDVGGIHGKQDLTINFVTGEVKVYNPSTDPRYASQIPATIHTTTIYEMVVAAIGETEAQERFQWKVEDDGSIKTFAGNTYHTLDFFYLERGGGSSNMEMQYNLVSTYDFTAHKSLHRTNSTTDENLSKNQFKYKLTGYPHTDDKGNTTMEAVMPKNPPMDDVYWQTNYTPPDKPLINSQIFEGPKTLIVGNSADGNINFGDADLVGGMDSPDSEFGRYVGQTFRYKIEELLPDGAIGPDVNGNYRYHDQTVEQNPDGTYTFDGVTYDNTVYYFEGTVSPEGWINKVYYTDETFTVRKNVSYAGFNNRYDSLTQVNPEVIKELYTYDNVQVQPAFRQFSFRLWDVTDPDADPILVDPLPNTYAPSNSEDGTVIFNPIMFSMDDIDEGEEEATFVYKITEDQNDTERIDYLSPVEYFLRVHLTDTEDHKLVADVKYCRDRECTDEIDEEYPVFRNKEKFERVLTVDKTVGGNIGSRNREFSFTLTMPDMKNKTVSYSTDGGETRSEKVFDENGNATFSLKHGESIAFYNINGAYTVTEATTAEEYITTWHSAGSPTTEVSSNTATGKITADGAVISFTNTLDTTPPTGLRDSLAPALAGIAGAVLMLLTVIPLKKREING